MSRKTLMTWGRLIAPVLVLALLVWRLGTGPFLDGVRTIDGRVLVEAVGIAVLTTVCAAILAAAAASVAADSAQLAAE